jgi:hypothetical protein
VTIDDSGPPIALTKDDLEALRGPLDGGSWDGAASFAPRSNGKTAPDAACVPCMEHDAPVRLCAGCGTSLAGRDPSCVWCTAACRSRARARSARATARVPAPVPPSAPLAPTVAPAPVPGNVGPYSALPVVLGAVFAARGTVTIQLGGITLTARPA